MKTSTVSSLLLQASVALLLGTAPAGGAALLSSTFTSVGLTADQDIDVTGPTVVDWGYYGQRQDFLPGTLDNRKAESGIGTVSVAPGEVTNATANPIALHAKFTMTFDGGISPGAGSVEIGAGLGAWAPAEDNAATLTFNDLGVGTHTVRVFVGHSSNDRIFDMDYSVTASDGNLTGNTVSNSITDGDLHSTYEIVFSTADPDADLVLRFNSTSGGTGSGWIGGYVVSAEGGASPLLNHWKLDETDGQVAADAAGSNPGTLGSSSAAETEDPEVNQPGAIATAYHFNGAEFDRVGIENFAPLGTLGTGTICGWFKTGSATRGAILSYGEGLATATDRLVIELQADGRLRLVIRENDSNVVDLETTATYLDEVWHHFAYRQDGTGITLYVDGSEVTSFGIEINSGDWFDSITNVGLMTLGYEFRGLGQLEFPFTGSLDDLAIFSRPLTPQELANVIQSGADHFDRDATPPSITGLAPDGNSGVYPGVALAATFSEDIALTGGGSITLDDTSGSNDVVLDLTDPAVAGVSGNTLTLTPPVPLAFGTPYEVVIASGTVEDIAPAPNGFPGTAPGQWTFITATQNLTPPALTDKSPETGATDVPRATAIVATFDQNILAGTGDIVIRDLDGGTTTRTLSVLDASQVSLSGKVLTITPAVGLAADTRYAVQIAGTAIRNYSEIAFPGIPSTDETTWTFRTRESDPNVIFILADDQAWYDYGFMRRPEVEQAAIDLDPSIYQVAQTPAIDRLADEGLAFTHGYTPPLCRPSLAAIVTGAYPHQSLITGNDPVSGPDTAVEARMQVMNPLPRTLATQLGYTSFQTGKWWEGHHSNGGFTSGDTVNSTAAGTAPSQWSAGRPGYVTARHGDWGLMAGRVDYVNDLAAPADPIPYPNTVETVTHFIDAQLAADQPFFLWYAPFLPHTPHDPPTGLNSKYDSLIREPDETGDYFAKYYANIERFDGGVGAILDHLDAKGIAGNTIVVMICDNGWINRSNASAYAARSKQTPYEGGVRTPIIVRWPDHIKVGGTLEPQVIATPISVVDLVPTIHHALGLPTFPEMRGVSLLDLPAVAARTTVFTEDSSHDIRNLNDPAQSLEARVAIRDGWKLILSTNGNQELYHLYDKATGAPVDPHETRDLSGSNPARVSELTTAIVNWYAVGANDFASWVSDSAFGLGPGNLGLTADPDGDQLANGLEAWFGTHPGESGPALVGLATDGTTTTFSHPRNENPPSDLTGFYQWSPNLTDWYAGDGVDGPDGGLTVTISPDHAGPATTVTATASQAAGRIFLRAGVTQN